LNRSRLRFALGHSYIPGMTTREYWTKRLREAEQELDAATRPSDVNAAAARLMVAKTELKRLEISQPIRRLFRQAGRKRAANPAV
jgi:hypothetical protein